MSRTPIYPRCGRPRTNAHPCSIEGCANEAFARGWCRKHYMRWNKHGDPTITLTRGRPKKQRAPLGRSDGHLLTVCWCEAEFLWVPADVVRSGRTVSCGNSTCKETA